MDRDDESVLVILPTYDERETLPSVVSRLQHEIPRAHLLIIDDGSPDGTGQIADALAEADPSDRILVHHRSGKLGLGTAYVHGFLYALTRDYRYVVTMDSDGSHLPEELPGFLSAARAKGSSGAGLVIGARWVEGGKIVGWPWYRRWISRTGTSVARLSLRSKLHDLTSGFRAIDTVWLGRLDLDGFDSEGYGFQVETAWALERLGCPIVEVPITFVERTDGHSKMTFGIVWEALWNVLRWGWQLRRNTS